MADTADTSHVLLLFSQRPLLRLWSPKERERWKSGKAMQWTCNVMCSAALMCLGRVLGWWQWSLERMKTIENQFVEPCWTIVCPQYIYIIIINYICIKWSQRIEQICKQDRWELVGGSSLKQRLVRSVCPWMERFSRGGRTFAIV